LFGGALYKGYFLLQSIIVGDKCEVGGYQDKGQSRINSDVAVNYERSRIGNDVAVSLFFI